MGYLFCSLPLSLSRSLRHAGFGASSPAPSAASSACKALPAKAKAESKKQKQKAKAKSKSKSKKQKAKAKAEAKSESKSSREKENAKNVPGKRTRKTFPEKYRFLSRTDPRGVGTPFGVGLVEPHTQLGPTTFDFSQLAEKAPKVAGTVHSLLPSFIVAIATSAASELHGALD